METGTRDFASPEEAEASPLASALFSLGDVTGVFFGRDFVSVTIAPGAEWADAKPDVLGIVMDHFLADVPLFNAASAGFSVPAEDRSAEHTSALQSLMRISYAVFCLKKQN